MIQAAQIEIATTPKIGDPTSGRTGAAIQKILGPLKTVVTLLRDDDLATCLVTTALSPLAVATSSLVRSTVAETLGLPAEHVLVFSSHNHCTAWLAKSDHGSYVEAADGQRTAKLLPFGKTFVRQLCQACRRLPSLMTPVTVHWAVGQERRITYNRKGRRADGSSYFMREEDRLVVARDYTGDIDPDATVVCFQDPDGRPAGFLTHFTGHPVTAYHPERPIAFGEWPQVACDHLGSRYGGVPAGFMQGCAGDTNSKHFLSGDVQKAERLGRYLGQTFVKAARHLTPSRRDDLGLTHEEVHVPFARLPSPRTLERDLREIEDFVARAENGDEDTLRCVGLNFPQVLSPTYRGKLVEPARAWTQWALRMHESNKAKSLPTHLPMEVPVLRIGDVGIVALPCEPFLGVGRQIKAGSPLPVAIPCGYANTSYGYVTDAPNTGDCDYMSGFYRYTVYWPPYRKPAGDVLARAGVRMLKQLAKGV